MAIDVKYGYVTTERGTIGDDEPVFVVRAQDRLAVALLIEYRQMAVEAGSPQRHLDGVNAVLDQFAAWQADNPTKVPESA